MATTYAEVADKLTKKLGELEKTLKTSTEPTEIESAKRMTERVQQALELLKASQQNHPEAESPEGQGMQQGMEQQMMPQQGMEQGMMPQQGGMPQGQPSPEEMAMMQQQMPMPQQQGMSPYQTGGYLPSYQASSSTLPYKKFTFKDGTILEIPEGASIDYIKNAYNNAIHPEEPDPDVAESLRGYIEENNIDISGTGASAGTSGASSLNTPFKPSPFSPNGGFNTTNAELGLTRTTNADIARQIAQSDGGTTPTSEEYTTAPPKPNALEPAARSRMQDPALSALGLAPTLGNLYMAGQKRDYYPGFYPKQAPMDFGQTESLLGEARDRMSEGPMYNPRPELVKAEQARKAQMANAQNASGSARFALQNMAEGQKSARTSQILGHAQNVNAQNERAKAQGLMGLAGAYGNLTTQRYGAQQRALDAINAEQKQKWDLDARTDATSRAFAGAGLSQLGQWAQLQQQMGNQYDVDSERSKLLGSMYSNYGYTPQGWEYDPTTGKAIG